MNMASGSAPSKIEIQVDSAARLFHTLDPFPFRERDLDSEAEEFIVAWARELPRKQPITIVVHLPKAEAQSLAGRIFGVALNQYFHHRADRATNDLRELFRTGRYSLLIGIFVLSLCVMSGRLALTAFGESEFTRVLNEGLNILGWVANWRPVEIFLYDWWPLVRRRRLYRRLADANVQLQATNDDRQIRSSAREGGVNLPGSRGDNTKNE